MIFIRKKTFLGKTKENKTILFLFSTYSIEEFPQYNEEYILVTIKSQS